MLPRVFRFGEFTLDMDRYQLQRREFDVKLENLPLRLMMMLVDRRGQLVSRREIEEELWDRDVFVDVEQGINTAIRKIRQVLRDHPEKPRYLQTVVGKGYRFIAVEVVEGETRSPGTAISKPENASVTVTLEQLGQAILSAAGLESVLPNLSRSGPYAQAERSGDPGRSCQNPGCPALQPDLEQGRATRGQA
jgi:DNA-binding winged helix-turn-helix (wHTH) protein